MDFFSSTKQEYSDQALEKVSNSSVNHRNESIVSIGLSEPDFTIKLADEESHHQFLDNTYYNLIICLEGSLSCSSNKENFTLLEGGVYFSRPGSTPHTVVNSGMARYYQVAFKENFISKTVLREAMLDKVLQICDQGFAVCYPDGQQFAYIQQLVIKLYKEMVRRQPLHKQMIKLRFVEIMLELVRADERCSSIVYGTVYYNRSEQLLNQFTKLIEIHYLKLRLVQDYADLLFVTAKHLSEVIKKEAGETALGLIHNRLFSEAKFLLCRTEMSIKEIADKLNFDTSSHFGRFIKQFSGYNPSDYRAIHCTFL